MATSPMPSWGPTCGQSVIKFFGKKGFLVCRENGNNQQKIAIPTHFPPVAPIFPCFLVAKCGKMRIARPSHKISQQKVHLWGFWPKDFSFSHQKPIKNSHFPAFYAMFPAFSNVQNSVPAAGGFLALQSLVSGHVCFGLPPFDPGAKATWLCGRCSSSHFGNALICCLAPHSAQPAAWCTAANHPLQPLTGFVSMDGWPKTPHAVPNPVNVAA